MYNLYYIDPFTGRQLLRAKYSTLKDLKVAWLASENAEYLLQATEEKEITTLPPRVRHNFQN